MVSAVWNGKIKRNSLMVRHQAVTSQITVMGNSSMSDLDSNRFYVYLHLKPNGDVFYVGKGTRKRAWSYYLRNRYWQHIVNCHGLIVEIHTDNLTEDSAFALEKDLIQHYRPTGKLTNVTDGGGGVSGSHVNLGVPKSEAHKAKMRLANLGKKQNKETIKKRKEAIKKLSDNGWINPGKREECKRYGIKNNNFAGFYVTPNGVYESINSAAKANDCTEKSIRVRCRGNVCIVKGVRYTYAPKSGWSFRQKE